MKFPTMPLSVLLSVALSACAGKSADTGAQPDESEVAPEVDAPSEPEEAEAEEPEAEEPAAEEPAEAQANLLETLRKTPDASRFLEEIEKAGLAKRLESTDEDVTALIPTNAAFDNMSKAVAAKMKKPGEAAQILQFHLLPESMDLNRVMDHGSLPTLLGVFMPVKVVDGTTLEFGDSKAHLVESNIAASNGMAHTIDQVLMPKK